MSASFGQGWQDCKARQPESPNVFSAILNTMLSSHGSLIAAHCATIPHHRGSSDSVNMFLKQDTWCELPLSTTHRQTHVHVHTGTCSWMQASCRTTLVFGSSIRNALIPSLAILVGTVNFDRLASDEALHDWSTPATHRSKEHWASQYTSLHPIICALWLPVML